MADTTQRNSQAQDPGRSSVQRARAPEDKAARRESILHAAQALFAEAGGNLPSVAAVARQAGLAKGTVYIYFRAKEDIFLALLTREMGTWITSLTAMLQVPDRVERGPAATAAEMVADLRSRRDMLRMAALCHATLEQQTDEAALLAFKQASAAAIAHLGQVLESVLPGMATGDGFELLIQIYAMTIGLWQLSEPPENARRLLARPELRGLQPDFDRALAAGLTALLAPAFRSA